MTEKFTREQVEWVEKYAYVMMKAGALNRDTGRHPDTIREYWNDFVVQYHGYVEDVPEEVRKSFRWNSEIESTFKVFSELEKKPGSKVYQKTS